MVSCVFSVFSQELQVTNTGEGSGVSRADFANPTERTSSSLEEKPEIQDWSHQGHWSPRVLQNQGLPGQHLLSGAGKLQGADAILGCPAGSMNSEYSVCTLSRVEEATGI